MKINKTAKNLVGSVIVALVATALFSFAIAAIGSFAWMEWWHPLENPFGRGLLLVCFLYLTLVAVDL